MQRRHRQTKYAGPMPRSSTISFLRQQLLQGANGMYYRTWALRTNCIYRGIHGLTPCLWRNDRERLPMPCDTAPYQQDRERAREVPTMQGSLTVAVSRATDVRCHRASPCRLIAVPPLRQVSSDRAAPAFPLLLHTVHSQSHSLGTAEDCQSNLTRARL